MNLAFGSRPGGGGTFPGGGTGRTPGGGDVSPPTGGEFPEMPEGGFPEMPEGGFPEMPGGGFPGGTTGGAMGRGGMGGRSNPLVTRFLADDEFAALYADALDDLRADLFDGGLADELLAARVATLLDGATALVDETTIESEADAISTQLTD